MMLLPHKMKFISFMIIILIELAEMDKQFPYSDTEKADDTKCESKSRSFLQVFIFCIIVASKPIYLYVMFNGCS